MFKKTLLNNDWMFHYGELTAEPLKTAKKAAALGGITAPLSDEMGNRLPVSTGGIHFLKLIAQGNTEQGLVNLAGTDLTNRLSDDWNKVDLPHDWNRKVPFVNDPEKLMSGSKPDAIGYYRKTFTLEKDLFKKENIILHFDGVMRMADVWINGVYLGHNNSGYNSFSFDISQLAHYGKEGANVLLVRADTTTGQEGWWYEGAGIYRSVWLEQRPLLNFDRNDCYIHTIELTPNLAKLKVECSVRNDSNVLQTANPAVFMDNKELVDFGTVEINGHQKKHFETTVEVKNPNVWSPENPTCYNAEFKIKTDTVEKKLGIHTFEYNTNGFILNGKKYELHGVCEHQDFVGVGTALNQDIVNYKIKVMKNMGVNALRSTHHFASEELLNACDELGIILINENRLLESSPWRIHDLQQCVLRDRMHPSIAFWSISNEELIGNTSVGSRIAAKLVETIKQFDQEHLVIGAELLNPEGIIDEDYVKNLDVLGVNYPEAGVMGPGAQLIHKNYPDLPMMSTENASYFSTRGVYADNEKLRQCNNLGSNFSMVLPGLRKPGDPGIGGTARPEEVLGYLSKNSYMGGVFLWTAFDYYGEPSPFNWPAVSSQFGIVDLCGFPKDYYYYYQAHWTKKPMVHVMPSWNENQLELDEQGYVKVRAFSNASELELFVNNKSYGKMAVSDCQANWSVKYEPGELKVLAYQEDKVIAQTKRVTSQKAENIECIKIHDGKTTALFELRAIDSKGNFVEDADNKVNLNIIGGKIIANGNGNPIELTIGDLENVKLFNGLAMVIVSKSNDSKVTLQGKLM